MTTDQERELRNWATQSHDERCGFLVFVALDEITKLRGMVDAMSVRIAAQSELLSKKSEKPSLAEFYAGETP